MPVQHSPAIAARMLGQELTKLRIEAGLAMSDVDTRIPDMSMSKLSRIERGEGAKPKIRDIEALLIEYDADVDTVESIMELTKAAREAQRWFHPDVLYKSFRPLVALEDSAIRHRDWESQRVPGLLQTKEYARAILEVNPDATPKDVGLRLQHRMNRQQVLNHVQLWAIIDEDVLHRPVGGIDVMQAQLGHLLEISKRRNVILQVVPRSVGAHAGMAAGFMLLDFPEKVGPPAVYTDTVTGGMRTSQPAEVEKFDRRWEQLRTLALNPTRSAKLINEAARNL